MPGHQCSPKRLHMIKGRKEEMEEFLDVGRKIELEK
jgi:hypothetical protein